LHRSKPKAYTYSGPVRRGGRPDLLIRSIPAIIGSAAVFAGVWNLIKTEPNKAMETTPVNVTARADARTAPFTSVSHLDR
jgi:hypothetical protein